jgi:hypothetical protein
VTNPDRVASFDWVKELGAEEPIAPRLRGVSGAASEAQLAAAQIDAELKAACAAIAGDLGQRRPYASAPVACQAAIDAMRTARAGFGPAAKIVVNVHPATCPASLSALSECAKRCNGEGKPAEVTCAGATIGRCPGACDGLCEVRTPGQCDGTCVGRCDGTYIGVCDGTCKGTCNGAEMKQAGACKGTCEGSCDGILKGPCKGTCKGSCQLKAAACAGVCAGKCSVGLEDARCAGAVRIAGLPECASYCELRAIHRTTCEAALVDVHVEGVKDAKARSMFEGTIERNLPLILKVEAAVKDRLGAIGRAKTDVAAGLKAITDAKSAAQDTLSPCIFGYEKGAVEGADGLLASFRAATDAIAAAKAK